MSDGWERAVDTAVTEPWSPLTVRFLVGSAPPELCGVGDHTDRLAVALSAAGHDVQVVVQRGSDRWGAAVLGMPSGTIVHLHYPSVGMGSSPAPLFDVIRRRGCVVTLHEFGFAHPLRRAMCVAVANLAETVVVTTQVEAEEVGRWLPGRSPLVVPIASNVDVVRVADVGHDDGSGPVGYFGLLAPGKGVEDFLALAHHARRAGSTRPFVVIGGWLDRDRHAMVALRDASQVDGVSWTGRLQPTELSSAIAGLSVAYLPYPDGVSERRTTALAMLAHGVPLVTTDGPGAIGPLRSAVTLAATVSDAWQAIERLARQRPARRERIVAGLAYAEERSWPRVVAQHVALYRQVAAARAGRA